MDTQAQGKNRDQITKQSRKLVMPNAKEKNLRINIEHYNDLRRKKSCQVFKKKKRKRNRMDTFD